MCTQSVVLAYGLERVQPSQWSPMAMAKFEALLAAARRFDEVAEQPHCEDSDKLSAFDEIKYSLNKRKD
jgi:hypothetical protein